MPRTNLFRARAVAGPLLILLALLSWRGALGQGPEGQVASIKAVRTDHHPAIDGVIDDACWKRAPRIVSFIQHQPEDGKAPTESTAVQIAYDDQALYVAMQMYDSQPDKIVNRLTRRDRDQDADYAFVAIDSYHDHQTGYMFLVYASGTQQDVHLYNDNSADASWDAVWESATKICAKGWTAEFRIPFDCLRFTAVEKPTWGVLAGRFIARKQEDDRWPYIPQSAGGLVSRFGHIEGLEGLQPPRQLEVLPYAVSREETEAKSAGNPDGRDLCGNAGLDAKYGITSNITLNATFNPDFGQVEADQTVLNLSAFETFYPEKRPFFLEGSSIFATNFSLFYSRRIGKAPSGSVPDAAYFIENPGSTTILGAAKVTGKTRSGTAIGLMEAVTQREKARYIDSEGASREAVVEPEANYFVTRLKQDVLGNSYVGMMATAVNQEATQPAYTGGVDWILRSHGGDYATHGQVVASSTAPGTRGWGSWARLAKEGGEHIVGNVDVQYADRKLDLDRAGFLERNNIKQLGSFVQYRDMRPRWIVNRSFTSVYAERVEDLEGLKQSYGCNLDVNVYFKNGWSIDGGGWVDLGRTYFDWETRGGPPVPIPMGQSWNFGFSTDERKWWQLNPSASAGDSWDGQFNTYQLAINLRPRSNVELSLSPSFSSQWKMSRWLKAIVDDAGHREDIFGEQYTHRFDMTIRGTLTFTRDLTLQLYAQPFIAAVDYRRFKRLVPPDSYQYVDSSVYDESVEKPDFNWKSFNSNVVLRWEYKPGSTLYLVWTQTRQAYDSVGTFKLDRDINGLFDTVAGNTFLVKANYRLMM